MDRPLKIATPLVLLVLAALVWFEPLLPSAFRDTFGDTGVLRFVAGLLAIYLAMVVVERQRMEGLFTQTMGALKEFHEQLRASRGESRPDALTGGAPLDPARQDEAIRILVAALASGDPEVRRTAAENLQRLTGQSHGEDVGAWRRWLDAPAKD